MDSTDDVYLWRLEKRGRVLERLQRLRDGAQTDASPHLIEAELAHLQHLEELISKHDQRMHAQGHLLRAVANRRIL